MACGSPTAQVATSVPTQAAAQPTAAPTSPPAAKPAASPPAPGTQVVRLDLAPNGSEARYRAQEQLASQPLPSEAVGSTRDVSGEITLAPGNIVVPEQSTIVVDLRTLRSDSSRRDNWIQRDTLETSKFPNAELVLRELKGLPTPLPASGEATFQLIGDLSVHGVTRPTTWQAKAMFGPREVAGTASTRLKMTDFGMTPPRVGPVLALEDELTIEIDFKASHTETAGIREMGASASVPPGPAPAAPVGQVAAVPTGCPPTQSDSLGPFYKPDAPLRDSVGSGYRLTGVVRTEAGCAPLPGAQVELWLANAAGNYDDAHRATLRSGAQGEYRFESNVPPPYAGRPPHIHLRVSAAGVRTLVTQHYPTPGQAEAVFDLVVSPG